MRDTSIYEFAETAKGFTGNPLGIIALFLVLVYGFATLTFLFADNLHDSADYMVWFLIIFPFVAFFGFLWLVSKHHAKLYSPKDFRNDHDFLRLQFVSCMSAAIAGKNKNSRKANGQATDPLDWRTLSEKYESATQCQNNTRKYHILWIDDHHDNNIFERKALECMGISFILVSNTVQASHILENNTFQAVISDMHRKEGNREGIVLLECLKREHKHLPVIIYTGMASLSLRKEAKRHGAYGLTNSPQELCDMVLALRRGKI